jgi:hypothetical protein
VSVVVKNGGGTWKDICQGLSSTICPSK